MSNEDDLNQYRDELLDGTARCLGRALQGIAPSGEERDCYLNALLELLLNEIAARARHEKENALLRLNGYETSDKKHGLAWYMKDPRTGKAARPLQHIPRADALATVIGSRP